MWFHSSWMSVYTGCLYTSIPCIHRKIFKILIVIEIKSWLLKCYTSDIWPWPWPCGPPDLASHSHRPLYFTFTLTSEQEKCRHICQTLTLTFDIDIWPWSVIPTDLWHWPYKRQMWQTVMLNNDQITLWPWPLSYNIGPQSQASKGKGGPSCKKSRL